MEWHINDLSLDGQFPDPQAFRSALEPLLQLRRRDPLLRNRLYCSRLLHARKVTPTEDFKNAVRATGDKTYIGLALEWSAKAGPFWDDERQSNEDDYFEYQGSDVTDQGLGEAARRRLVGCEANVFSFQSVGFETSPLSVQQGLAEKPIRFIDVANCWQINHLKTELESCRELNNWNDVHIEIMRRFDQLVFSTEVMADLFPTSFSQSVKERIFQLLDILNTLVIASDDGGKLSHEGEEILKNYFAGTSTVGTPLFKPETATNQRFFKKISPLETPMMAQSLFFVTGTVRYKHRKHASTLNGPVREDNAE